MSNEITPRFFSQVPAALNGLGLNSTDKLVFGCVYTMLNVTGKCFMSNARIAENVEIKPNTAAKSLNKLEKIDLIRRQVIYKDNSMIIDKRYITLGQTLFENSQLPIGHKSNRVLDNNPAPIGRKSKDNKSVNRLIKNNATTTDDAQNSESKDEITLQDLLTLYQQNIGDTNSIIIQEIRYWCNDLSPEVVQEAIKRTAQSNNTWRYTTGILRDWVNHNVKTLDQVKANDVRFKKKNEAKYSKRKKNNPAPQYQAGDEAYRKMAQKEAEGKLPWED